MAQQQIDRDGKPVKLGRGKRWATAIDLGTYSVKVASVGTDDEGHLLVRRAVVEPLPPLEGDEILPGDGALTQRRSEALRKALARHGAPKGRLVVGLSRSLSTVRYITLPSVDPDEIRTMLFYDIERHVPFPVEALEIDFEVVRQSGEQETLIMMVSALREEILAQLDICAEAGLRPDAVDIDVLGACAAYGWGLGPEASEVMLDLGRDSVKIGILSQGTVLFSRSLPVAESRLLELFPDATGWDDLKTRFSTMASLPPHERAGIESWFDKLSTEVMRSVASFRCEPYGQSVNGLILCGGAGYLPPGPSNPLGVRLRTNTVIQPPLNGAIPESEEYHGCELATVVGFGLRALQPPTDHTNLIPREVIKQRQQREKKSFLINASILIMLGLGMLFGTGYFHYDKKAQRIAALRADLEDLKPREAELKKMEEKVKVVDSYLDTGHSCLTILYQTLVALPQVPPKNVSLSSISYEKRKDLNLKGQVRTSPMVDEVSTILRQFNMRPDEKADDVRKPGEPPILFNGVHMKTSSINQLGFDGQVSWDFEFNCVLVAPEEPKKGSTRNSRRRTSGGGN